MATELVSNISHEPCSFGWIHTDRAGAVEGQQSLPDPKRRRTASIDLSMRSAEELFNQGLEFKNVSDYKSAIDAFNSAIQLQWSFTAAYIEAGNCASLLQDFESALKFYSSAIETDPVSPVPYYNIGLTFVDLEKQAEAIKWLRETIRIDPQYRLA